MNFGEISIFLSFGTKVVYQFIPKLGIKLRCCNTCKKGIILTGFGAIIGFYGSAVTVNLIINKKLTVIRSISYKLL